MARLGMPGPVCDHLRVSGRVSSPVFVGRAAGVAQLEMTLRQVVAGASATVVVSGEAGVGKTVWSPNWSTRRQDWVRSR